VNEHQAELVDVLTKRFTDKGKLVEAGWQAMRFLVVAPTAPENQLVEMRMAYFAGAQHVFASLMSLMGDDGGEPTADELRRVDLIHAELKEWENQMRRENGWTEDD